MLEFIDQDPDEHIDIFKVIKKEVPPHQQDLDVNRA